MSCLATFMQNIQHQQSNKQGQGYVTKMQDDPAIAYWTMLVLFLPVDTVVYLKPHSEGVYMCVGVWERGVDGKIIRATRTVFFLYQMVRTASRRVGSRASPGFQEKEKTYV